MTRARRSNSVRPVVPSLSLAILLVVGLTAILVSPLLNPESSLTVGRPSPSDFDAPRPVSFESEILTARARDRAAAAVAEQFEPTDPAVAGQQVQRVREVLAYIELVRADEFAAAEDQRKTLVQIPEMTANPPDQRNHLLDLDQETWVRVAREVPIVVAQTLRQPVRPDTLGIARASVVANVDRSMDPSTAQVVAQIAGSFILPNTTVDEEKTAQARLAARQAEPVVVRSLSAGETVVRAGDIVTAEHLEALEKLGLVAPALRWRDVLGMGMLMLTLVGVASAVLQKMRPGLWRHPRPIALVVLLLLAFAFGARIVVPSHVVLAYAYPAAAVAMTLTVLFGLEMGAMAAVVLALVTGLLAGPGLEMAVYVLASSLAGAVVLSRVERLSAFLVAGSAVALASSAVVFAYRLPGPTSDIRGLTELAGAIVAQAALSTGLAALGGMAVGSLFGITTSIQLLELARPDQPLLRELQTKAPGTYQHCLVLANMAEAAAVAIGADALLVRVGAYYHDIGKTMRPYFFIENQLRGTNPHDGLDPSTSAQIIIEHVTDGVDLARQHGLPQAIVDFVLEHHGTTSVAYFHRQAVAARGPAAVDETAFRYPGPRPQSRETAIIMLADSTEAAVRAAEPAARAQIDDVIRGIFERRVASGQLDESDLTLRDLSRIRTAFGSVLQSMYHPRIKYPDELPSGTLDQAGAPGTAVRSQGADAAR